MLSNRQQIPGVLKRRPIQELRGSAFEFIQDQNLCLWAVRVNATDRWL